MDDTKSSQSPSGFISRIVVYWFPLTLGIAIVWLVWNKFQKGLSRVPGPTAASYTGLWRVYQVFKGRFHEKQIKLHRQYGKLVRIAPHVVSVGDPRAISTIYSSKHDFLKSEFYPIQSITWKRVLAVNVFSTRDPVEHREEKRKVNLAYSMSNLLRAEDKVDSCTAILLRQLDERSKGNATIDLGAWLQYYAFDVVGELTFAEKLGFLEAGEDIQDIIRSMGDVLAYMTVAGQCPVSHKFLMGNPILTKLMPPLETWNPVLLLTLKAMNSRTSAESDEEQGPDMLSRWLAVKTTDPLKMSTRDLVVNLATNVFAGGDTTSIALRSIIYNLCRHPEIMAKTVEEIDKADQEGKLSNPLSYRESITHLPYYACVLKEAMRLHPSVGLIMERHVPPGGVELCGKYLPPGTIVGINPWVLNYDPEIFEDPEDFIPERWQEKGDQAQERENILMFNFGAGARSCLGKNISMMEMHKIVPELLRNYTIELAHPEAKLKSSNYWFVQQHNVFCRLKKRH